MRDMKPYRKKRHLSQSLVSKWNLDSDGIRRVMWTMFAVSLDICGVRQVILSSDHLFLRRIVPREPVTTGPARFVQRSSIQGPPNLRQNAAIAAAECLHVHNTLTVL